MWRTEPWRSAACTHEGKVRVRNEDAFLDSPHKNLWVVADGMGGYQGGDIASQLVVISLAELPRDEGLSRRVKTLCQCLRWLNRRLNQEPTLTAGHRDATMGSTVVALLIEGNRAVCIWAGDSRCYLWRSQRLYQLSKDHSLQQRLVDEHHMTVEQANSHPNAQALTRAVGADEVLSLGVSELEVRPGDTFLLCSDGLYKEVGSDALGRALSLVSPQAAISRLFDTALEGSARDNLTAVVIRQ